MTTPRSEASDRIRGLYGIADAAASGGDPERLAAAMLVGGCRLVQLRCKGWDPDDIRVVAAAVVARCRAVGATFIVNDHADIAASVGADGVHVGQLDAPADDVRTVLGPERILGRSTHSVEQAESACEQADYVAFGPIWQTPRGGRTKGVRGIAALAEVRARVSLPLVAIGGITVGRVAEVRAAGADAWAVIGAIALAVDPEATTRRMLR